MVPSDYRGVPSAAAIFGHPIHPMLVVFPIGFFEGALVAGFARIGMIDDKSEALPSTAGTPITGIDLRQAGRRRLPR